MTKQMTKKHIKLQVSFRIIETNHREVAGTNRSQNKIKATLYTTQCRHLITVSMFALLLFLLLSLMLLIYESLQT